MASINVDFKAVRDARIKRLGIYLVTNKFDAIGRLNHVWVECTEAGSPMMRGEDIDAIVEHEGFAELMVKADLAEKMQDGLYRVKGCEGRIEWLAEKREAAKKGGEARAKSAKRSESGAFEPAKPAEHQPLASHQPATPPAGIQAPLPANASPSASAVSIASPSALTNKKEELNLPAKPSASARQAGKSVATWEAYRGAYQKRYGEPPIRNAMINGQLAQLVKRLPEDEAPLVAEFYLTHPDQFYVRNKHPVGLLLKDAEKLRTEWATGHKVTGTQARHEELRDSNVDVVRQYLEQKKGSA